MGESSARGEAPGEASASSARVGVGKHVDGEKRNARGLQSVRRTESVAFAPRVSSLGSLRQATLIVEKVRAGRTGNDGYTGYTEQTRGERRRDEWWYRQCYRE